MWSPPVTDDHQTFFTVRSSPIHCGNVLMVFFPACKAAGIYSRKGKFVTHSHLWTTNKRFLQTPELHPGTGNVLFYLSTQNTLYSLPHSPHAHAFIQFQCIYLLIIFSYKHFFYAFFLSKTHAHLYPKGCIREQLGVSILL